MLYIYVYIYIIAVTIAIIAVTIAIIKNYDGVYCIVPMYTIYITAVYIVYYTLYTPVPVCTCIYIHMRLKLIIKV